MTGMRRSGAAQLLVTKRWKQSLASLVTERWKQSLASQATSPCMFKTSPSLTMSSMLISSLLCLSQAVTASMGCKPCGCTTTVTTGMVEKEKLTSTNEHISPPKPLIHKRSCNLPHERSHNLTITCTQKAVHPTCKPLSIHCPFGCRICPSRVSSALKLYVFLTLGGQLSASKKLSIQLSIHCPFSVHSDAKSAHSGVQVISNYMFS